MRQLRTDLQQHMSFLADQSLQVLQDFCKLTVDYLEKGPNIKLYFAAAQKLQVDPKVVQNCVEGLIYLLVECTKNKLTSEDFKTFVINLGFTDINESLLSTIYVQKQRELCSALSNIGFGIPQYHNMEWRFEVQIASRSLLHQIVPMVTLDFTLKNPETPCEMKHVIIQSDPTNLLHLTQELEAAIQEGRSQHIRKIKRNFK